MSKGGILQRRVFVFRVFRDWKDGVDEAGELGDAVRRRDVDLGSGHAFENQRDDKQAGSPDHVESGVFHWKLII